MRLSRRRAPQEPLISVIVPVYNVRNYLTQCLDSVAAQTHQHLQIIVVDDGSTDGSGGIADAYATRDSRIEVHHTANAGLGAARNWGARFVRGEFFAYADSDDTLPPESLAKSLDTLIESGSDFVTGSIARMGEGQSTSGLVQPPWMARLHRERRLGLSIGDHPEILGDVFAWNKLFRAHMLTTLLWPEGVRYEDQPATTAAYLNHRFDVITDVVYHWRIRTDGSSITQAVADLKDIRDRMSTKRSSLDAVARHGSPEVTEIFLDRVLAGDLHRYFRQLPQADDQWWRCLTDGVQSLWAGRTLATSGLPPVHRVIGVLVEQGRRQEATRLVEWMQARGDQPAPRGEGDDGIWRLDLPDEALLPGDVPPDVLVLRDWER